MRPIVLVEDIYIEHNVITNVAAGTVRTEIEALYAEALLIADLRRPSFQSSEGITIESEHDRMWLREGRAKIVLVDDEVRDLKALMERIAQRVQVAIMSPGEE